MSNDLADAAYLEKVVKFFVQAELDGDQNRSVIFDMITRFHLGKGNFGKASEALACIKTALPWSALKKDNNDAVRAIRNAASEIFSTIHAGKRYNELSKATDFTTLHIAKMTLSALGMATDFPHASDVSEKLVAGITNDWATYTRRMVLREADGRARMYVACGKVLEDWRGHKNAFYRHVERQRVELAPIVR